MAQTFGLGMFRIEFNSDSRIYGYQIRRRIDT
jgi:hypothetical protein